MTIGVLLTRPESEAARTARQLQHEGYYPVMHPVLRIQSYAEEVNKLLDVPADAILITSPQAAQCWLAKPHAPRLPMFVVGEKTAATIRDSLPYTELSHAADGESLLHIMLANYPQPTRFLYPRGQDVSFPLTEELVGSGHMVHESIVYKAERGLPFSELLVEQIRLGEIDAVLHYSQRSAQFFVELARDAGVYATLNNLTAIAISPKVAEELKGQPWERVEIAATPDEEGVLAALRRLYPNGGQIKR